jgi:hypothetical protein
MMSRLASLFHSWGRAASVRAPNARAFTLAEMLLVIALSGSLTTVLLVVSLIGNRSSIMGESHVHVHQEARKAMSAMTMELRQAGGTIAVAAGQLDFQLPIGYGGPPPCGADATCWGAADAAGAVHPDWSVRYRLNGTQLVREVRNGVGNVNHTRVLANDINSAIFTYAGPPVSTVAIQLQARRVLARLPNGQFQSAPLRTKVKLRNL